MLIKTLSGLDIACCNHASRDLFLILAGRINFTAADSLKRPDCRMAKNLLLYMHWIHSRQLAVKTLYPTHYNFSELRKFAAVHSALPFVLPSVTCLQLDIDMNEVPHKWLMLLLKACPNLTHLETSIYDYESKEYIWKALVTPHLPKLKKLVVPTLCSGNGAMLTVLAKYGHQLEELHIVGDDLDDAVTRALISKSCPQLRVLSCGGTCTLSSAGAELLIASCGQLTELTMKFEFEGLSVILEAGKHQLQRVRISTLRFFKTFGLDQFADMLMRYPTLEELTIDDFQYSRSGELTLKLFSVSRYGLKFANLERVFQACTVRKLNLDGNDNFVVDATPSCLGGSLNNLESLRISTKLFEAMLPCLPCSLLRQLILHHHGTLNHTIVEKIASSCPRLQSLQWSSPDGMCALLQSDRDVLLTGCPELKDLPVAPPPVA